MFTKTFLDTTNPNISLKELLKYNILLPILGSVIFHTIIYMSFVNIVNFIFFGKIFSNIINKRLLLFIAPVMFFGFFARFIHVKEIYKSYNYDLEKARKHMDKLYISWIFIS
jgi:hypothetical protein